MGIGGQGVGLQGGKIWSGVGRKPDSRTAIGIDAERKLLFLAVAEWASPRLMLEQLAKLGARDAMLLDGGRSSAIAIEAVGTWQEVHCSAAGGRSPPFSGSEHDHSTDREAANCIRAHLIPQLFQQK